MLGNRGRFGLGRQQAARMPRSLTPVALAAAALTAACGTAPSSPTSAGTFTPGAGATASAAPANSGGAGADDFVMPPFGSNLHVIMTDWLPPAGSPLIPAVVAAKDYYLALYYSEYVGGTDSRWMTYTGATAKPTIASLLKGPLVAGQSFTGTISFTGMTAAPDPSPLFKGDIDVSICVATAHSTEDFYPSEKPEPKQPSLSTDDYRQMAYIAQGSTGQWYLVGATKLDYIPASQGCPPS
jgi:hypothetical protein